MPVEPRAHRMSLPGEVVIGSGVVHQLGEVAQRVVPSRRAIMITNKDLMKIVGNDAIAALEKSNFSVEVVYIGLATEEAVEKSCDDLRKHSAGVVVAVGGGSVIDTAKLCSTTEKQSFISVPTSAAHDGISSPRASIKKENTSVSVQGQSPIAIVADTHIVAQAPFRFTAAGCGDLISKITAVRDWKLAHTLGYEYYGEYAASLSLMGANIIMENAHTVKPNDEQSVRLVLEALIASGIAMGIAGSSRPASGSEHKFSHALDQIASKPALHGEQCGLGTIMMAYLHAIDWDEIRTALATIGAPTKASQLGFKAEHIIEALTTAHAINPTRYTILGDRGLTEKAAERLARITGVIE
ncbi:MAG: NAD(P)-dependent glycerol-1-phosphate dehydrogenase [Candidatus Hodarchaeota archaeon]